MPTYKLSFVIFALVVAAAQAQIDVPPVPAPEGEYGVDVLTRGPIHEGFASTVSFNPEPGVMVSKQPPEPIVEIPPDQRPDGDNVTWIPGYWGWDDDRRDFLWISGVWRALPPGRQWVPGYWSATDNAYQWTSGYWADLEMTEVEYLEEPPASVEAGPNVPSSGADQTWIPGTWVWQLNRYVWRPGYWVSVQPQWVWIPAYYSWTPRGYVFVDGYYDYAIDNRGLLFAPVYFNKPIYTQPQYSFSPQLVVNVVSLASQLFLRPNYQHYYFGDYYASRYSNAGFFPWYSFNTSGYGYDPIFAHQRWIHRSNRNWESNVVADFERFRDQEEGRPPRTWVEQRARQQRANRDDRSQFTTVALIDELTKRKDLPLAIRQVTADERNALIQTQRQVDLFRRDRQNVETRAQSSAARDVAKKSSGPVKVKLSKSPVAASAVEQLGTNRSPPRRHEVLKPDLNVRASPRAKRDQEIRGQSEVDRSPKSNSPPSKTTGVPPKSSSGGRQEKKTEPKETPLVAPNSAQDKVPRNRSGKAAKEDSPPRINKRSTIPRDAGDKAKDAVVPPGKSSQRKPLDQSVKGNSEQTTTGSSSPASKSERPGLNQDRPASAGNSDQRAPRGTSGNASKIPPAGRALPNQPALAPKMVDGPPRQVKVAPSQPGKRSVEQQPQPQKTRNKGAKQPDSKRDKGPKPESADASKVPTK